MKVLRLIGGLDPGHGGPPVSALNSCIAAQRAGAATTIAFPAGDAAGDRSGPARQRLEAAGIAVVTRPYGGMPRGRRVRWGISPALGRWLLQQEGAFDIVHCHGAWQYLTLRAVLARRRLGARLVLSPHESLTDFDVTASGGRMIRIAKRALRPWVLGAFDHVVMASAIEARDSVPASMSGRVGFSVIPHAVFDEEAGAPAARMAAPGGGRLRLGVLGRMHPKKNIDVAIRALAELPDGITLTIAGDGAERGRLEALVAECGIAKRIDWTGFVEGAAKEAFFAGIDLLAMPSDYECFGMAAAEAMAHAVPVLVTRETGVALAVEKHGAGRIIAADARALSDAAGELAHHPDRLAAAAAGAGAAAAAEFSFAAHGRALVRCYEQLPRRPA